MIIAFSILCIALLHIISSVFISTGTMSPIVSSIVISLIGSILLVPVMKADKKTNKKLDQQDFMMFFIVFLVSQIFAHQIFVKFSNPRNSFYLGNNIYDFNSSDF